MLLLVINTTGKSTSHICLPFDVYLKFLSNILMICLGNQFKLPINTGSQINIHVYCSSYKVQWSSFFEEHPGIRASRIKTTYWLTKCDRLMTFSLRIETADHPNIKTAFSFDHGWFFIPGYTVVCRFLLSKESLFQFTSRDWNCNETASSSTTFCCMPKMNDQPSESKQGSIFSIILLL